MSMPFPTSPTYVPGEPIGRYSYREVVTFSDGQTMTLNDLAMFTCWWEERARRGEADMVCGGEYGATLYSYARQVTPPA